MSLKEMLFNDFKVAMRDKQTLRKDTIQIVRAGILQIEKDSKVELQDDGVLDVISKELKKRYDVLPDYEKSGRQDLIQELNEQIVILKGYLPEQLTESKIIDIVDETIKEVSAISIKDMGKVMNAITPKIKGKADNRLVSDILKKKLSNM